VWRTPGTGDMDGFLLRAWEQLLGRTSGPFRARFILQPVMASLIAIRAGINDAKAHRNPYLWAILSAPAKRGDHIRGGWKDAGKVLFVAFVLDCTYQFVVLKWFYPLQAVMVAFVLAAVPYVMVRGPTARIASRIGQRTTRD
jgi:hypothetical protein